MDDMERLRELGAQGFYCSQILLLMGLDLQGKSNPDLVRAGRGLAGGLGFTGDTCGTLTSATCLLGLYAGKGVPADIDDPRLDFMIMELVKWFKEKYGEQYGGIRCEQIVGKGGRMQATRCPQIVLETYQRVKELLVENGFDLAGEEL